MILSFVYLAFSTLLRLLVRGLKGVRGFKTVFTLRLLGIRG
jgi:hypothetical protein